MNSRRVVSVGRVVPVIRFSNGQRRIGSGYRIAGAYVLTAAHCVRGRGHRVWLPDGGEREAQVVAAGEPGEVDLALLRITISGQDPVEEVPPTWCARVDRTIAGRIAGCLALGYPQYAARPEAPFTTVEVEGWIPAGAGLADTAKGRRAGFLTLKADGTPPRPLPTGEEKLAASPWAGMSGAAVFASGLLVGVVAEHHLPEGDGSLTVVPIEWAERLADPGRTRLLQALGVKSAAEMELLTAGAPTQAWAGVLPEPPTVLVERPELQAALRQALQVARGKPVLVSGMGGSGKSVLVSQLAREVRAGGDAGLRAAFPAGVAWLTLGRERPVGAAQLELAWGLGEEQPDLGGDWQSGRARLRQLAEGKRAC